MNATNAKGLNAMKQKVKRNNKDFQEEIEKFREDKFEVLWKVLSMEPHWH